MATDATMWGIHAGKTGDADSLFLKGNVIALGWPHLKDLSKLPANRDAFKQAVIDNYPDRKPLAYAIMGGQLYRFVHEVKIGDIVIYPSKRDRRVNLGQIESDYRYSPDPEPTYPNQRAVKWIKALPRTSFTQGALYEIGSAMSLFQVKNYADEFRGALEGKLVPTPAKKDETLLEVSEDIEDQTRDFVLKTLSQELKGHPLAEFIAHLLKTMGYRTRVSPEGPDGGIDIVAHRDELGFEPPIIKVQVKSGDGSVGDPVVSSLYGKVGVNEHGLLVTLGTFTNPAVTFAKSKSNLRLIDGDALVDLILEHYEQFDSRYKGILPLKRAYIPQPPIEDEE